MRVKSAAIVTENDVRVLRAFGEEMTVLLDGDHTAGTLAMWTAVTGPGGGPPLHYHLNEDETLHILEGRVALFLDGEWNEVGPGTTVFLPRGVVHTFKNIGDTPCRMLNMATPSGFEKFFARCAEEFTKSGDPDMSRIREIGAQHGIFFLLD